MLKGFYKNQKGKALPGLRKGGANTKLLPGPPLPLTRLVAKIKTEALAIIKILILSAVNMKYFRS